jgi:hypothetical protein
MWNFLLVTGVVGVVTGFSVFMGARTTKEGKRRAGEG